MRKVNWVVTLLVLLGVLLACTDTGQSPNQSNDSMPTVAPPRVAKSIKAIDPARRLAEAKNLYEAVCSTRQYDQVFTAIDEVMNSTATTSLQRADALVLKATCVYWLDRYQEAVKLTQEAIHLAQPDHFPADQVVDSVLIRAYFIQGRALSDQRQWQEALQSFETIADHWYTDDHKYFRLVLCGDTYLVGVSELWRAQCYLFLNQPKAAKVILLRAQKDFSGKEGLGFDAAVEYLLRTNDRLLSSGPAGPASANN